MRALLFFNLGALALAQGEVAVETMLPLSLKRAVEIALAPDGSPRVTLAQESIRQAETRRLESRAAFLPDLESSVSDQRETTNLHAYGFGSLFTFPAGFNFSIPTIAGPFSVFDARATVSQMVFDFSTIRKYQEAK